MIDQYLHRFWACMNCSGFCCNLMFLHMDERKMKELCDSKMQKVQELAGQVFQDADSVLVQQLADKTVFLQMLQFGVEHFHRVEGVINELDGEPAGAGEGFPERYAYRCDQYNVESGRCMCYEKRPWTCQSFICGAAAEGRIPTHKDFAYSTQFTDEQAAQILENRGRAACKKACSMAVAASEGKEVVE